VLKWLSKYGISFYDIIFKEVILVKKHTMKIYPEYFNQLVDGSKTREYRLYDEKRQKIKLGDVIEFINTNDSKSTVLTKVIGLCVYKSFYTMYEEFFDLDFKNLYDTVEDIVIDTYPIYSKEQQEKYGGLVLKLKKIK